MLATVRQCRSCCRPKGMPRTLVSWWDEEALPEGLCSLHVDTGAFEAVYTDYKSPVIQESEQEKAILDSLSPEEMLLLGDGLRTDVPEVFDIAGTAGKTATALIKKGIPNVVFADGPAGLNLINRCFLQPGGGAMAAEVPERCRWGTIGKMAQPGTRRSF
jgi:hypothetical protein